MYVDSKMCLYLLLGARDKYLPKEIDSRQISKDR
jgi:hypothetical protein